MKWLLLALALLCRTSFGQASFGGEIMRFNVTNNFSTQVCTITNGLSAGNTLVILMGMEANSGMSPGTCADDQGNIYTCVCSNLINSVHQIGIYAGYIQSAIAAGNHVTITWGTPPGGTIAKAAVLVYASNTQPTYLDAFATNSTFSTFISSPITVSGSSGILFGISQIDQLISTNTGGTWNQIGAQDIVGYSPGNTDGLANRYLYLLTSGPGTYTLDGTLTPITSYQTCIVGLRQNLPASPFRVVIR
jgi:hypothetical protein